jgi:hypothetical protein
MALAKSYGSIGENDKATPISIIYDGAAALKHRAKAWRHQKRWRKTASALVRYLAS